MNILTILLEAATTDGTGGFGNIFIIIAMIAIFYFFMIRPQMKKTKLAKKFREELKKGANIVTIGGIHGKIIEIKETIIIIETESKNKLKIEKSAISPEFSQGTGVSDLAQNKK